MEERFTNANLLQALKVQGIVYFGLPDSHSYRICRMLVDNPNAHYKVKSADDVIPTITDDLAPAPNCVVSYENSARGLESCVVPALVKSDVNICAEIRLPIPHALIVAQENNDLKQITHIVSDEATLSECASFITQNNLERVVVSSHNHAIKYIEAKRDYCAIGPKSIAGYGQHSLDVDIQDDPENHTRFLVLRAKEQASTSKVESVTSVPDRQSRMMISIYRPPGTERCRNTLSDAIDCIVDYGVKLRTASSVPHNGKYVSLLELYSHKNCGQLLRKLQGLPGMEVKCLGQYPVIFLDENAQPMEG